MVFGVGIAVIACYLIIVRIFIFDHPEIEQCKTFLLDNTAIRFFFGTIESIEVKLIGSGKDVSSKKGTSGYYSFRLKGSNRKANVKVLWRLSNGKVEVTQVSMRTGFAGTVILWPESEATPSQYLLPSHIWDGIILLFLAFLNFLLHLNAKKNGKIVQYLYPAMLRIGNTTTMAWGFLIVGYGCIAYSILCFLNICTLF